MKRLVVMPSDPLNEYINLGKTWEYLEKYYNPKLYFDKVYCLSPWKAEKERYGTLRMITAHPLMFHKVIKKINPLAVRAYGGYHCADWAAFSKVQDIPVIVSVHDSSHRMIYDGVKYADCIVCMSEIVRTEVHNKLGIPKEQMLVMPNRIDTNVFFNKDSEEKKQELNQKYGNGKHILHVGRKSIEKNIDTVIRALKILPGEYKAIFAGRGNAEQYICLAQTEGVIDRCTFIESIKNNELPYYYSWCDCFCTPSRWEGFGMVFIEAAACEAMIVTSNIGPMNEYLTDGKDAILVDGYEDPKKMAEAILRACEKNSETARMKKNARQVGLKFSKEAIDAREIEIYKQTIACGAQNIKVRELSIIKRMIKW